MTHLHLLVVDLQLVKSFYLVILHNFVTIYILGKESLGHGAYGVGKY